MALVDSVSIRQMSGISTLILFFSEGREKLQMNLEAEREEMTDSGFSLRWTAERNLISICTNHCPGVKKNVWVSSGRERKRIKSTQLSIFAYSDYEKVPIHQESFFCFPKGFCVL